MYYFKGSKSTGVGHGQSNGDASNWQRSSAQKIRRIDQGGGSEIQSQYDANNNIPTQNQDSKNQSMQASVSTVSIKD